MFYCYASSASQFTAVQLTVNELASLLGMAVYSSQCGRGSGVKDKISRKDKEFLGHKCIFFVTSGLFLDGFEAIFSNFRVFLMKMLSLGGLLQPVSVFDRELLYSRV